jgi:thiamine-monophosphate kinase
LAADELAIIDRYFRALAGEGGFKLLDDAARLTVPADSDLVVTTDMVAIGVHFLPEDPPDTVARKALRVNLSDLAAKGARPLAYVLGAGLPAGVGESWLEGFADGLRHDQSRFGVSLLGGDTITVAAGPVISITAFGVAPKGRMVHRFGGKPGDSLYLSGSIGGAALGLALLKGRPGPWTGLEAPNRDALVERYRVPEPRVALAGPIAEFASAAMDVSDGLLGDCDKLAAASECGALILGEAVPVAASFARSDPELFEMLIAAGDDYEILAAVAPLHEAAFADAAALAGVEVTRVGELTESPGPTKLLFDGAERAVYKRAYVHGRD